MSLKHAILGFLSFRSLTGYDLKKAFDASVQHFWPADQSQIYRTLRQLHKVGHVRKEVVEREDQLNMKVYHITEEGREELIDWLSSPMPLTNSREPHLIKLYFGALLSDEDMLALLRADLAAVEDLLATYSVIHAEAIEQMQDVDPRWAFYTMLTLEYGIAQQHTYRDLLLDFIDRIERGDYGIKPLADQLPDRSHISEKE